MNFVRNLTGFTVITHNLNLLDGCIVTISPVSQSQSQVSQVQAAHPLPESNLLLFHPSLLRPYIDRVHRGRHDQPWSDFRQIHQRWKQPEYSPPHHKSRSHVNRVGGPTRSQVHRGPEYFGIHQTTTNRIDLEGRHIKLRTVEACGAKGFVLSERHRV